MANYINELNPKEFQDSLIKAKDDFLDEVEKLIQKYLKKMERDIKQIIRLEIDTFYADYDPHMYNRSGSLYDAFEVKINIEKFTISIDVDYIYMKDVSNKFRKADNKLIFHNSIELGWHGGAIPSDQNANTVFGTPIIKNTPYYRSLKRDINSSDEKSKWKGIHFDGWLRPAEIMDGDSPIERINNELDKYIIKQKENVKKELNDNVVKFQKKIRRIKTGYDKWVMLQEMENQED